MKILAVVESLTGNTMSFVEYAKDKYEIDLTVIDPFEFMSEEEFSKYDKIMLGCYTWDFGKMPAEMKEFIIDNRDILLTKDVLLFGSGWSVYDTFCLAVDGMNIILNNQFPTVKFELRFDPEIEIEAVEALDIFINKGDGLMYTFADKINTKFVVAGKSEGCPNCKNLKSFLQHAVSGEYDKDITVVNKEDNEELYGMIVNETQSMSVPIVVNLETGKHITGFNPPELMEMLKS